MDTNTKNDFSQYKRYYQSLEPFLVKPKSRAYTTTIFSFLAISLFGWYGIKPTLQTILFLRREIADNMVVNKQMEDKITNLIQAQSTYEQVSSELPLLNDAVPENPDVVPLVFQMKNLASEVGASIAAVTVQTTPLLSEASASATKQANKSQDTVITVAVVGQYQNLKAFLDGLLTMRRIVTVSTLGMSLEKSESALITSGKSLRMILKMTTYYGASGKTP